MNIVDLIDKLVTQKKEYTMEYDKSTEQRAKDYTCGKIHAVGEAINEIRKMLDEDMKED